VVEEVLPIRDDAQRAYVEAMVHVDGTGLLKEDSVLRHLVMCKGAEEEAADPKKDTVRPPSPPGQTQWSVWRPGLLGSFLWYRPGLCQSRFRMPI
jgi:hypothetical protein